ncbi:hypothetical protein ACFPAF_17635 [Hymenobacter endophyticus]|uniref:Uncharacterized protein n=1 Tax=Hymenobacter endophyticus TaxID=3076335 RepID=A0ABU3TLK2_9BACT|nr:hypothetical protein [Hymenobacter endophyticus]MDU0372230.1 hypothetical protein [Hymenobacter endophyticus]
MLSATNKDAALLKLGFTRISLYRSWDYPIGTAEETIIPASDVRYLHQTVATDGTRLYAYSWVEEPGLLLTTERHVSALQQVVAELETNDLSLLEYLVDTFFQQHGGRGSHIISALHRSHSVAS